MQSRWEEFSATDAMVLAVAHSSPDVLREYLKTRSWSFEVVTDPERVAYTRLGLGRAALWDYLRPKVLLGYLRIVSRGWEVRRPFAGEDLHQLGGDFVLDRQHRLRFAWPSADPTDRPSVEQLLMALGEVI